MRTIIWSRNGMNSSPRRRRAGDGGRSLVARHSRAPESSAGPCREGDHVARMPILMHSGSATDRTMPGWAQVLPLAVVFVVFFIVPLGLTAVVSLWNYSEYEILPDVTARNYLEAFEGCADRLLSSSPALCTTLKTYLTTLRISATVWLITLILGFAIAYFLAFHVRLLGVQIVLFLLCTIPFWTSNVIRMISWIPLLGRNGLI